MGCLFDKVMWPFQVNLLEIQHPPFKNDSKFIIRSFENTTPESDLKTTQNTFDGIHKTSYDNYVIIPNVSVC